MQGIGAMHDDKGSRLPLSMSRHLYVIPYEVECQMLKYEEMGRLWSINF